MIKIIENPNPVKEEIRICENCKCKFSYTKADVNNESWNNEIIGPGHYGYSKDFLICPNCGEQIIIEEVDSDTIRRKQWEKELDENESIFPHLPIDSDIDEIINIEEK